MTRKKRRLYFLSLGLLALGGATALMLSAVSDSLLYFYSPSDLIERPVQPGQRFRLGGLVEDGSVLKDGETVRFIVTDLVHTVPVTYTGILPDLFREGQGVVTEGVLDGGGAFQASSVLAKHDETYMPPEVAESLKASGYWEQGVEGAVEAAHRADAAGPPGAQSGDAVSPSDEAASGEPVPDEGPVSAAAGAGTGQ